MKTAKFLGLLLISISMSYGATGTEPKAGLSEELSAIPPKAGAELRTSIKQMMETATVTNPGANDVSCKPLDFIQGIDKTKIIPTAKKLEAITKVQKNIKVPKLKNFYDKGQFPTLEDKALNAISNVGLGRVNFDAFVLQFTGSPVADLAAADIKPLQKFYQETFTAIKFWSITEFVEYDIGSCTLTTSSSANVIEWDYPSITWSVSSDVKLECNCNNQGEEYLEKANYYYKSKVKGIFTKKNLTFRAPSKPTLKIEGVRCCPLIVLEAEEQAYLDIPETPQQYVGLGAGVGFENDFDQTTFCVGAEYMYNVAQPGNNYLYAGAAVTYVTSGYNDFNRDSFALGPKVQLNTPISATGETQWTNGIKGFYAFGNNDGPGFETTFNGFQACLYTGFNIPISDNIAIGIDIPILNYENLTFDYDLGTGTEGDYGEPDPSGQGDSYKVDGFSLFINKAPAHLSVRFGF